MKKKLMILAGSLLLLAAGAVFVAGQNKNITADEILLMRNVEALGQEESDLERAIASAYNSLYDALYSTVRDRCPTGSIPCVDVTTELSIPGWASMSVTIYFYKES